MELITGIGIFDVELEFIFCNWYVIEIVISVISLPHTLITNDLN